MVFKMEVSEISNGKVGCKFIIIRRTQCLPLARSDFMSKFLTHDKLKMGADLTWILLTGLKQIILINELYGVGHWAGGSVIR